MSAFCRPSQPLGTRKAGRCNRLVKRQPESTFSRHAPSLLAIFCVGSFRAFLQGNRLLLLGRADGFTERSLYFDLIRTDGREKRAAQPLQFGIPFAFTRSFAQRHRLFYSLKRLGSTAGKI